jgi:hypothetical protein
MTPDEGGDLLFDVQRDDVDAASVFPDCDTPKMKRIGPYQIRETVTTLYFLRNECIRPLS